MPYRHLPSAAPSVVYRARGRGHVFTMCVTVAGTIALGATFGLYAQLDRVLALREIVDGTEPLHALDAVLFFVALLLAWNETRVHVRVTAQADQLAVVVHHWPWPRNVRRFRRAHVDEVAVVYQRYRGRDAAELGLRMIDGSFAPFLAVDVGLTAPEIALDGQRRLRALLAGASSIAHDDLSYDAIARGRHLQAFSA